MTADSSSVSGNVNRDKHFDKLPHIEQAIFVLQEYSKGLTRKQVTDLCDGDEQGVNIWTQFCKDLGWISNSGTFEVYSLTPEGLAAMQKWSSDKASTSAIAD